MNTILTYKQIGNNETIIWLSFFTGFDSNELLPLPWQFL